MGLLDNIIGAPPSTGGGDTGDNVTPKSKTMDMTMPKALADQGSETVTVMAMDLPKVLPDLSLYYWDLNLTAATLTLYLHGIAKASSLDVTKITLQDAYIGANFYTLTNSTTASSDGETIVIDLSVADKGAIHASGFCTWSGNSWITFTTGALTDMSANPIQSISDGRARQVTNYS